MKKRKATGLIVFGVIWFLFDRRLGHGNWFGWFGIIVALYGLSRLLTAIDSDRNLKAIKSALAELDCIQSGLRFLGRESELVDWRRSDNPRDPGPIQIVQLCRSRKEQWFEFRFEVRAGRAYAYSVKVLSEDQARAWLSYDVKAYQKVFSPVEVA